ncbi:MAG TPA: M14 family zinc carboxypeptidase [Gemmatimonadaceae bacterium]|nr:M14 family zinc carboxypeptidase [Gemmatimonadaceae bacterium]
MRAHALRPLALLLSTAACAVPRVPGTPQPSGAPPTCCLAEGLRIAERHRAGAIDSRRFTHETLWRAIEPSLREGAFRVEEIGRSVQGREIRAVTWGGGPTTVLLWSQMHGDESTATMALADIFGWLAAGASDPLRDRLGRALAITFVPMLNPDGAELFQRENALGIDVNRDARRLTTPEGRALKSIRDRIRPDYGFNLHDQSARIAAGPGGDQVAIALLAPAFDEARGWNPVRSDARLVAASIAAMLEQEIPGRIAKYDDAFNPRAFGDLMQQWGTRTVLVESGAIAGDPEKQRLRAINVAIILTALDAIATGRARAVDAGHYERLPFNERIVTDVLIAFGTLVLDGQRYPLDLAFTWEDPLGRSGALRLREVGDLTGAVALDTIDATGLFLHLEPSMLTARGGGRWLRLGAVAALTLRHGEGTQSEAVRRIGF